MDDQSSNGISSNGNGGAAAKDKETVKVVVRCRPLFGKEIVEGRKPIVTIDTQTSVVAIKCPENDQIKPFTFDSVYDEATSQRQFYDESAYPLVESIFDGYNGTIFAYGQTGCGKTHTMQGKDSPPELRGVIPLSFDHIFESIRADPSREYMVRASYLEIYNEDIRDLLSDDVKKKLELKESADGSVYVKDLTEVVVNDVDSINRVMSRGFKNRTVGATLMNEGSSRSHSIFTVVVETSQRIDGREHFKAGKLNLVDLAGSERQSKTGATGNRLKEGCKINLSLSALGNVISALVDGKGKHIPYRDSKLTRLLQDSLGGNTKTLMVAAVSPADYNYDETLSTLRYANRAKNIKNKPVVNEDPKDAKLREYKDEIERLKKLLESQSRGSALGSASGMSTPRDDSDATPILSRSALSSAESASRNDVASAQLVDQALAKEREEIAKYQREAAEMLQRAKQMMDDARALQDAQQQQSTHERVADASVLSPRASTVLSDGAAGGANAAAALVESPRTTSRDAESAMLMDTVATTASSSSDSAAFSIAPAPLKTMSMADVTAEESPVAAASPSVVAAAGAAALGSLPPLKTPRTKQLSRPDVLAELPPEKRELLMRQDSKSSNAEAAVLGSDAQSVVAPVLSVALLNVPLVAPATTASAPPTATLPIVAAAPAPRPSSARASDEAIAQAMLEAARIDAQAKEMMARAEQLMRDAAERELAAAAAAATAAVVTEVVVVKEVIPDAHVKAQAQLEQFNEAIRDQRDRMGEALERTQQAMEASVLEKHALHSKLRKIESQILGGSSSRDAVGVGVGVGTNAAVDSEVALLQQQVAYRRAQIKLKATAKREAQSSAARRALALEKQQVEEELKTAQEAAHARVAAAKRHASKSRAKLEAARLEIADLASEFERERESLLDTIREQTKETKLLEQLVELFLPQPELVKVWERATWSDEREEWTLPKLRPRSDFQKLKLPALQLGSSNASGATGSESGGAEVISDDDCGPGGGGGTALTSGGGATARASCSSASSTKRRKPSLKDTPAHCSSNGSSTGAVMMPAKPSSSNDAGMFTTRSGDSDSNAQSLSFLPLHGNGATALSIASHHAPPMHSSRPEHGRLPSALRSSRYESPLPLTGESTTESSAHRASSKKASSSTAVAAGVGSNVGSAGAHRPSKERHGVPPLLLPTNNEARSPPMDASERFFPPSEHDLLAPLASEYEPRDRLQSRKGSRQGSRGNGTAGSSSGQSSVNEFDSPPPADRTSRGPPSSRMSSRHSTSSNGASGDSGSRRHHRERHDSALGSDRLVGTPDASESESAMDTAATAVSKKSKTSSTGSSGSSSKHKKRRDKKERHTVARGDDADESDLHFANAATAQSPEDVE